MNSSNDISQIKVKITAQEIEKRANRLIGSDISIDQAVADFQNDLIAENLQNRPWYRQYGSPCLIVLVVIGVLAIGGLGGWRLQQKIVSLENESSTNDEALVFLEERVSSIEETVPSLEKKVERILDLLNTPSLDVTASPSELSADGESTSHLTISVQDEQNNSVVDNMKVTLSISPEEGGRIVSNSLTIQNGRAETDFIAGNQPGEVEIIAVLEEGGASDTVRLKLTQSSSPEPKLNFEIGLDDPSKQSVEAGEFLTLIFLITNQGNASAHDVSLSCNLPEQTTYQETEGIIYDEEQKSVQWDIGDLAESQKAERRLELQVDPEAQGEIFSPECWVEYPDGGQTPKHKGEAFQLPIQGPPYATQINLTAENGHTTLPADGVSQLQIRAQVFNQYSQPMTLPLTFTLQPSDMGTIDPIVSEDNTIYTAPGRPGTVTVIGTTGSLSGSFWLSLTGFKLKEPAPLLQHTEDMISSLPANTPISERRIPGDSEEGFEHVAIDLWIPRDALSTEDQASIVGVNDSNGNPFPVYVGKGPDDPLNKDSTQRQLQLEATKAKIEILDDRSDSDLVQIRMQGLIQENNIVPRQ